MSPADAGICLADRPLTCGSLADGASMQIHDVGEMYRIEYSDGLLQCSCPAWVYQQRYSDTRTCKHVRSYLKDQGLSPSEGGILLEDRPEKCGVLKNGEFLNVQGVSDTYFLEYEDGFLRCSCPAWKYQRLANDARTCKHVDAYLKEHGLTPQQAGLFVEFKSGAKPGRSKSPSRHGFSVPGSSTHSPKAPRHFSEHNVGGPVVDADLKDHLEYFVVREKEGPWDTVLVSESGTVYILQLLQRSVASAESFFVWARDGRSGTENSILQTVESLVDGKAAFDKRFYDLTGNYWSFGRHFQRHVGKYVLLGMP